MNVLAGGFNPIKHVCETQGCWNQAYRPPIEFFARVLPNKIAMMDIDATVEVNGHFLFLEWKSHHGEIPIGQRIYFQRLTKLDEKFTVGVVRCDGSPRDVVAVQVIKGGVVHEPQLKDLEGLVEMVGVWSNRVKIQTIAK